MCEVIATIGPRKDDGAIQALLEYGANYSIKGWGTSKSALNHWVHHFVNHSKPPSKENLEVLKMLVEHPQADTQVTSKALYKIEHPEVLDILLTLSNVDINQPALGYITSPLANSNVDINQRAVGYITSPLAKKVLEYFQPLSDYSEIFKSDSRERLSKVALMMAEKGAKLMMVRTHPEDPGKEEWVDFGHDINTMLQHYQGLQRLDGIAIDWDRVREEAEHFQSKLESAASKE